MLKSIPIEETSNVQYKLCIGYAILTGVVAQLADKAYFRQINSSAMCTKYSELPSESAMRNLSFDSRLVDGMTEEFGQGVQKKRVIEKSRKAKFIEHGLLRNAS